MHRVLKRLIVQRRLLLLEIGLILSNIVLLDGILIVGLHVSLCVIRLNNLFVLLSGSRLVHLLDCILVDRAISLLVQYQIKLSVKRFLRFCISRLVLLDASLIALLVESRIVDRLANLTS